MKTLNKTLGLVLALVMVLGLFGVASATTYTDENTISYKQAVGVMTGLGAINGYETGDFKPLGDITRAEAAKVVAYAVLGKNIASKLTAGSSSFTDVDAGTQSWAGGSIEYLVSKGIINGRGNGIFDPNGKVTGYELAKMMICAAGYGQKGEYVGTGWQLSVAIDAAKLGVFENGNAAALDAAATREEAALYVFNAVTGVTQVKLAADSQLYVAADATGLNQGTIWGEVYPTLYKEALAAEDNGGLAATRWYIDTDKSNAAGAAAFNPLKDELIGDYAYETVSAAYATGALYTDILKASGVKNSSASYTVETYRNGVEKQTLSQTGAALYAAYKDAVVPGGVSVEVVVPQGTTNTLRVLSTVHYLAKLNSVTLDTNGDDNDDRALNVTVVGYGPDTGYANGVGALSGGAYAYTYTYNVTAEDYAGFDAIFGMVKDKTAAALAADPIMVDVVPCGDSYSHTDALKTAGEPTVLAVAVPTTAEGRVTAKGTGSITVSGTTYATNFFFEKALKAGVGFTDEYTFVKDATGAVAYAKAKTVSSGDYAYVVKTEYMNAGSLAGATTYAKAQVILTDGTALTADMLVTNKGTAASPDLHIALPAANGTVADTDIDGASTAQAAAVGNWFRYVKNADGSYTFMALDTAVAGVADAPTLLKGTTQTLGGKNTSSATVVTAYDVNLVKSTWTGYAAKETALTGKVLYTFTGNTVTAVYAVNQAATVTSSDYAYAVKATGSTNAYGAEWLFAVNGAQVKYVVSGTAPEAGKVYNLSTAANDTYTVGTAVPALVSAKVVTFVDATLFVAADDAAGANAATYTYAAAHGVFNVDSAKALTVGMADTLEVGDVVTVYGSAAGSTALVFITTAK